jgi:hypothetical protein
MCDLIAHIIDGCTKYPIKDRWTIEKILEEIDSLMKIY